MGSCSCDSEYDSTTPSCGAEPGEWSFDFTGRNRRPPRDPVNALLSYAYALLAKELTVMALVVGFDPSTKPAARATRASLFERDVRERLSSAAIGRCTGMPPHWLMRAASASPFHPASTLSSSPG